MPEVKESPNFAGLPVVGDGWEEFRYSEMTLITDERGSAIRVNKESPKALRLHYFRPGFLYTPRVYGIDSQGNVCCSAVLMEGHDWDENPDKRSRYMEINRVKETLRIP